MIEIMFYPLLSLFIAVLFYILIPGMFFSFPKNGSFKIKAMVHAVLFALIYHITRMMASQLLYGYQIDYFANAAPTMPGMPAVTDVTTMLSEPKKSKLKPNRDTEDVPY